MKLSDLENLEPEKPEDEDFPLVDSICSCGAMAESTAYNRKTDTLYLSCDAGHTFEIEIKL